MRKIVCVLVTITALASNVFAQETGYKDVVVKVPQDVTVEVLGEGPDQVVEIPWVVQRIHEVDVAPAITNVTHVVEGNKFLVRSGLGVRTFQVSSTRSIAQMVSLNGEIGYSNSQVRLQATFNAGRCQNDTTAIGGDMALMYLLGESHFRVGLGAGLHYCTDTEDVHPNEVNKKRFISGFARIGYELGQHVILEGNLGGALTTTPIVDGLDNQVDLVGGWAVSFLL